VNANAQSAVVSDGLRHVIVRRSSGVIDIIVDTVQSGSPYTPTYIADLSIAKPVTIARQESGGATLVYQPLGLYGLRFYQYSLTAAQIAANYTAGPTW